MPGRHHRKREARDLLFGPEPTPESEAVETEQKARFRAILTRARTLLGSEQRRWLSALELDARMTASTEIDLERVAEQMSTSVAVARQKLDEIRLALAGLAPELDAER